MVVADWQASKVDATAIRHDVFVQEQHVPVEIELDDEDENAIHAVAYDGRGRAVGTGRLLRNAHIGRMAVRASWRGRGVGSRLLGTLVDEARNRRYPEVVLSAQIHARGFYIAHGFAAVGGIYLDAGIEHIAMRRCLASLRD